MRAEDMPKPDGEVRHKGSSHERAEDMPKPDGRGAGLPGKVLTAQEA